MIHVRFSSNTVANQSHAHIKVAFTALTCTCRSKKCNIHTPTHTHTPMPVLSTDCNVTFKYCRCICAILSMQWIVAFDFQDCAFSCLSLSISPFSSSCSPSLSRSVSASVSVAGMWLGSLYQTVIGRCSYHRSNLEPQVKKDTYVFLFQGFCVVNGCKVSLHIWKKKG